ncbi:MAG TPA: CPBP family intramembrane glutamic endopeptidase, partial [Candidatus Sulfomarinibacteraceae bacterium]|nr:CPBP family intramembrane glutamic endopeptidase [Candidatus Sulfomarinibacteraceae bacterium]
VALALAIRHGPSYTGDFWRRIVDWRRIGWRWLAVILLFFPVKTILAALIDAAQGGWGIAPEEISRLLAQPLLIVPTLLFWLFFGPVPEEPGWRGYALDGLQSRHGPVLSSFVVGMVWMLWHLPLFFLPGTWQAEHLGPGTLLFWLWAVSIIFESVLYTWIYNNTGRSILAAILFHFTANAFGQLFAISTRAEVYSAALSVIAALLVILFGRKTG